MNSPFRFVVAIVGASLWGLAGCAVGAEQEDEASEQLQDESATGQAQEAIVVNPPDRPIIWWDCPDRGNGVRYRARGTCETACKKACVRKCSGDC